MTFWLGFKRCKADADRLKIRHEWPGAPGAGIKSRARLPERGARRDPQHIRGHFLRYVKNFGKNSSMRTLWLTHQIKTKDTTP